MPFHECFNSHSCKTRIEEILHPDWKHTSIITVCGNPHYLKWIKFTIRHDFQWVNLLWTPFSWNFIFETEPWDLILNVGFRIRLAFRSSFNSWSESRKKNLNSAISFADHKGKCPHYRSTNIQFCSWSLQQVDWPGHSNSHGALNFVKSFLWRRFKVAKE